MKSLEQRRSYTSVYIGKDSEELTSFTLAVKIEGRRERERVDVVHKMCTKKDVHEKRDHRRYLLLLLTATYLGIYE